MEGEFDEQSAANPPLPPKQGERTGEEQPSETPTSQADLASAPRDALAEDHVRLAEAVIFASAQPVALRQLGQILPDGVPPETVAEELRRRYAGRGVELVEAAGGLMFRTAPDLAPALRKVVEVPRRLPRAAMETLAIIAYHQPVTRAEIEAMRGASLGQQTLESLLDAGVIAPAGHKDAPGRPTLWATTPNFLARFGLRALSDLPRREDLLVEPVAAAQPGPPEPERAEESRTD